MVVILTGRVEIGRMHAKIREAARNRVARFQSVKQNRGAAMRLCSTMVAATLACVPLAHAEDAASDCQPTQRVPYAAYAFLGFACGEDACAKQKAGFAWADRSDITNARGCGETGEPGFLEGCQAFTEAVTAEQSGFEWALENEVADDCLCRGGGPRFAAGCEAYVAGFGAQPGLP